MLSACQVGAAGLQHPTRVMRPERAALATPMVVREGRAPPILTGPSAPGLLPTVLPQCAGGPSAPRPTYSASRPFDTQLQSVQWLCPHNDLELSRGRPTGRQTNSTLPSRPRRRQPTHGRSAVRAPVGSNSWLDSSRSRDSAGKPRGVASPGSCDGDPGQPESLGRVETAG